jgi:AraC-like DNA-binding protein
MLRSFDLVTGEALPASIVAINDGLAALRGGGPAYAAPWHWHDCTMLLIPSTGALDFQDEDRKGKTWITRDRFAIVPAFRAHDTAAVRELNHHIVLFATDRAMGRLETDLGSLKNARRRMKTTGFYRTTPAIRSIQALCGEGFAAGAAQQHLGLALFVQCLGEVERSGPVSGVSPVEHGAALIDEIKDFIATNVDKDLPLDHIANRFDISRRHMTRLFGEMTGFSIGNFQQLKRIEAARQLLMDTDLPVGEIAFRVGLESGSALSRAMRRIDGQSPTNVRNSAARSIKRQGPSGRAPSRNTAYPSNEEPFK